LNLEEGRFMTPLQVGMRDGGMMGNVDGVNCVDVNPRHGLWSFGMDGVDRGHVEFWDPRSRSTLTSLTLPTSSLLPSSGISTSTSSSTVSITSLQSHPTDGLSLAVGTSTGHTLLYDMRSSRPFAVKDLGYGEKVRDVHWLIGEGGEGKVMSSDTKVVKVWEKNDVSPGGESYHSRKKLTNLVWTSHQPSTNTFSLHPPAPLMNIHPIPSTGLLLAATDSPTMSAYYVPELGPAPKWASFLDGVTEELEEDVSTGAGKGAYSDFKFVDKKELEA
jgi:ribosome biogenesis protein ENP2